MSEQQETVEQHVKEAAVRWEEALWLMESDGEGRAVIEAPVDQPWDLETAWSADHWVRLELDRAVVDLRDALGELVEPFLGCLSRVLTK